MCSCTNDNPFECNARHGRHACVCSCHRRWKVPKGYETLTPHDMRVVLDERRETMEKQGPREPLDEKDARIDQLRTMLSSLCRQVRASVLDKRDEPVLRHVVEQAEWTSKEEKQG